MKNQYICPNCKGAIESNNVIYSCKKCQIEFYSSENFINFSKNVNFRFYDIPKSKINKLIESVDNNGYDNAVFEFIHKNPEYIKFLTDAKSADGIFHCVKKENVSCLEIGSNLGNVSEILSKIFHKVYSLEWVEEKIKFQQKRFKNKLIKNISIFSCDPLKLPFPDNYFDLVVCNGLVELIVNLDVKSNTDDVQIKFLTELKRVIKNDGCICLGIENRKIFKNIFETDITFRPLENKKKKHSFQEYQKIFMQLGLFNNAYWVFPSFYRPYFSGKLNDKNSINWFYKNMKKFFLKEKQNKIKNIMLSFFGKINELTMNVLTKSFVPDIIFCCYKTHEYKSYEDFILENNRESSLILLGRRVRLIFILLNNNGPKKIISIERFGKHFPNNIVKCNRIFPNMEDPESRVWEEDWVSGKEMDPQNINDIIMAIKWLINFQRMSQSGFFSEDEKQQELNLIRKLTHKLSIINKKKYITIINEYEEFLLKHKISKVACQGDFWYTNIIIDRKKNKVNVVDWENFKKIESPFFDFLIFFFRLLFLEQSQSSKNFKESLEWKKKFEIIMEKTRDDINEHFGFTVNFIHLLRFFILKKIIVTEMRGEKLDLHIDMLESLIDK